jgi:hypothetical protein
MAHSGSISHDDPDPLPAEIWSVFAQFPSYHKLTGSLAGGIHDTLAYQDCISYLQKKHNMHPHLIKDVNIIGLQQFLSILGPSTIATIVKAIHEWAPTNDFLFKQG